MSVPMNDYARFLAAMAYLGPIEGGDVDRPDDRGGATRWGISLRFLNLVSEGDINGDGHVTAEDVWALTEEDKHFLYKKYFWDWYRIGEIHNQDVANRVFSIFVHFRGRDASLVVQRACEANLKSLKVDGQMGTKTFGCINSSTPEALLAAIRSEQRLMYYQIVQRFPDQAVNLNGWISRAMRI